MPAKAKHPEAEPSAHRLSALTPRGPMRLESRIAPEEGPHGFGVVDRAEDRREALVVPDAKAREGPAGGERARLRTVEDQEHVVKPAGGASARR